MNKQEFLEAIRARLGPLAPADAARSLDYYAEMIDDRVEDGLSEAEAVAEMEPVEEIAAQILSEAAPAARGALRRFSRRKLLIWEIVLLALGSPVWLSLVLAAAAVILAVYLVVWTVAALCFAVDLALAAAGLAGLFSGAVCAIRGDAVQALLLGGSALVCAGLAILLFFGCIAAAKGAWRLSKLIWRGLRALFAGKETTV